MRILAQVYGTPSAARTTGTTASRAVSSDRNSTPWRPASSIEYSRMLVSWKVPKYGSGRAVPNAVRRIGERDQPDVGQPVGEDVRDGSPADTGARRLSGRTGQWTKVRSAQC